LSRYLLTGIAGQDGFFMQKLLQALYPEAQIVGLYRGQDEERLCQLITRMPAVDFVRGDITDAHAMNEIIGLYRPHTIFNFAGITSVPVATRSPYLTHQVNTQGVVNLLEAIRLHSPDSRLFQASTSEMYGNAGSSGTALAETDRMVPTSPYGISKLAAHLICRQYRESHGMHVSCAISFNHESEIRPEIFVTRKVTKAAASIAAGTQDRLYMGNLGAQRDWGYAGDYVEAFLAMTVQDQPDDYVIGTGKAHSIRDLLELAFDIAGLGDWESYVVIDDRHLRPEDNTYLRANPEKAHQVLGWQAETTFEELIRLMVEHDMGLVTAGL
jgi:GDPmannose 4,6-dehydratase